MKASDQRYRAPTTSRMKADGRAGMARILGAVFGTIAPATSGRRAKSATAPFARSARSPNELDVAQHVLRDSGKASSPRCVRSSAVAVVAIIVRKTSSLLRQHPLACSTRKAIPSRVLKNCCVSQRRRWTRRPCAARRTAAQQEAQHPTQRPPLRSVAMDLPPRGRQRRLHLPTPAWSKNTQRR